MEAEEWRNDPDDGKITLWVFIIIIALTAGAWAINAHGKKGSDPVKYKEENRYAGNRD